jgi:molybdopterin-guanine dinucleotide biosynthesis protein A
MTDVLYGLVLAGGDSERMQADKALLSYHGKPQLLWTYELISGYCEQTFVSVQRDQHDEVRDSLPRIEDQASGIGPAGGVLAAAAAHPGRAWLVVACDLPFITEATLSHLVESRNPVTMATAYRSVSNHLPEPLCAIWEPSGLSFLREQVAQQTTCPRKVLIRAETHLLDPISSSALDNINTPDDRANALGVISCRK